MKNINPTIDLERQLAEQIYNALQGPIVEEVALVYDFDWTKGY